MDLNLKILCEINFIIFLVETLVTIVKKFSECMSHGEIKKNI